MTADQAAAERDPEPAPGPEGADVYGPGRGPLDAVFAPRAVAVVGASEKPGSLGRAALWNLVRSPFGGTVHPVTPSRRSVLGIKAYRSIKSVPEAVDLAVIVAAGPAVAGHVEDCAASGVGAAILVASGPEGGAAGLGPGVLEAARRGRVRLIGPGSLGFIRPGSGLNASVLGAMPPPGPVAFLGQDAALAAAILDWSLRARVGFSAFGTVGTMLDVGWGDLIDHLGDDPATRSIVIAMEAVGDARAFLSAAREVALTKPIIVLKPGRTGPAAALVAARSGRPAEDDEVLDAAFRRGGVLRAPTIADAFAMADVLGKQPRPPGSRLAIVSNAPGPSALAVDALVGRGGSLAELAPATVARLGDGASNPVDLAAEADPARLAGAVAAVAGDPGVDGVLAILAPGGPLDPTRVAEALRPLVKSSRRPILASWMGGDAVAAGVAVLQEAGIPTFPYPETAARVFAAIGRHDGDLRALYETPTLPPESEDDAARRLEADAVLDIAAIEGRDRLTESETRRVLGAHGLDVVESHPAATEDEAVAAAEAVGFPVALKLRTPAIERKSEVGGVHLGLVEAQAVREAFRGIAAAVAGMVGEGAAIVATVQPMVDLVGVELAVSSRVDPLFGPVLEFGAGGAAVAVYRDRASGLPPLTSTLARRLMEQTRVFEALAGGAGRPGVDLGMLEQFLVRFSRLIAERPRIRAVEVAPLYASPCGLVALDARVTLHEASIPDDQLPRPAIRPYPAQYASAWTAKDGGPVVIRPIRAEDEPLLVRFHETLSERSVALRYFGAIQLSRRVAHDRLTRICCNDYDREIALVVDRREPWADVHEILGVGRLSKVPGTDEAEFALIVSDGHQGRGFGSELLRRLLAIARAEKVRRVGGDILAANHDIRRVCEKLGFRFDRTTGDPVLRAWIDLDRGPAPDPDGPGSA